MPKNRRLGSGQRSRNRFASVPTVNISRSSFERSAAYKTTFSEGYLIPVLVEEVLPGDTFTGSLDALVRLATPLYPVMDNLYFESFFFFVPSRLLQTNWERLCGAQDDPDPTFATTYLAPVMAAPASVGVGELDLADYMGIPTKIPDLQFLSLPFRAYNLIWNTRFRDQNMQDSVAVPLDDGPDTYTDFVLLRRGKRHDYFTSCLPWPQKGPDVELPLGTSAPLAGTAPITGIGRDSAATNYAAGPTTVRESTGTTAVYNNRQNLSVTNDVYMEGTAATNGYPNVFADLSGVTADLSTATAATINDLRQSFQLQKFYEKDARGGTRYEEGLAMHFQVRNPDSRVQRPEYIGGGSTPFQIVPVAQTSSTSGSNALADLAAYGVCAPTGHRWRYSSTEFGYIIGLVSVRADITYQQGLHRMWSRRAREDFYWPSFAHLGEQSVLNQEIWAQDPANTSGSPATSINTQVFGYQERFAEYRYKNSQLTGAFRSNYTGTLDPWHLAQDFATLPTLGNDFIVENAPMTRVKAVTTEPDFIMDAFIQQRAARPMPVNSVPGFIDHF